MHKTIIKTFFIILLFSFLTRILAAFISDYNVRYNALFSFAGYFYLTLFFIKVFNEKLSAISITVIIFAGLLLLLFDTHFIGIPIVLACCLGIISAYFYLTSKPPKNILPFVLSSCFLVFMLFQGYDYWIHKSNFGTFTGKVSYNLPVKFEASDEKKNLISDNNFQSKIVLLDFWTTTCGVCFEKFPQVQTVYEKYRNDSSVVILAANKPIEEDKPNQAFEMIREEGYSFPVVVTKDEDLAEKFGVKGFPTTFVINRNGQIVYKGDIEGAIKMVDELKMEK